jgi:sugar (pentulose or hexulose) kinase
LVSRHLAVDLGAESGRALAGRFDGRVLTLEEIRRFDNTPFREGASLHWDVDRLWTEIRASLSGASDLASLGVDTWGCDYALLDEHGELAGRPWHYRDPRTTGVMDATLARLGASRVYGVTGIQFLPFNTLFQLVASVRDEPEVIRRARSFVTMPDLFNYRLTGRIACEYTNATTSQCVDAARRAWAVSLIEEAGLPSRLFGPIVEAGTVLGDLKAGLTPRPAAVVAPACHDTGSAVAAVRTGKSAAYLSSGTWSLLGVELDRPLVSEDARASNFTNEGGVYGTTRFLKNIAGLWLLQACRRDWAVEGHTHEYADLVAAAAGMPSCGAFVDPDDPSLLNPRHMPDAIAAYCRRTGQEPPAGPAATSRAIFESLALKYRVVLESLEALTGRTLDVIRVIGGGSRNRLLNQLTADVTGRTVIAGPVEATALGNIAVQLVATGRVASIDDARDVIDRSFPADRFEPADSGRWDAPYRRFRQYLEITRV